MHFCPATLGSPHPTTISIAPTNISYIESWVDSATVSGAVITAIQAFITSTIISIPPVTTTAIALWNVVWDGRNSVNGSDDEKDQDKNGGHGTDVSTTTSGPDNGTFIWLTSSVSIPPITITHTNTRSGVTSPPITWTFSPGPYPPVRTRNPEPPDHLHRPKFADEPDVPIPPGPPPEGFPSRLGVRGASPAKPTCRPGQKCGPLCRSLCNPTNTGCKGICGCIGPLCEIPNCVGPGCFTGGDATPGKGEKSCRRSTTVSFSKSECTVLQLPSTTTTTCKKDKCSRTLTACETTGSTTTTTTTLRCPFVPLKTPDLEALVPSIGDGSLGGFYTPGDFTFKSMDEGPTSTEALLPTTTLPSSPTAAIIISLYAEYVYRDESTWNERLGRMIVRKTRVPGKTQNEKWVVYALPDSAPFNPCDWVAEIDADKSAGSWWPSGTFELPRILDKEGCVYKGNLPGGSSRATIECPNEQGVIRCTDLKIWDYVHFDRDKNQIGRYVQCMVSPS